MLWGWWRDNSHFAERDPCRRLRKYVGLTHDGRCADENRRIRSCVPVLRVRTSELAASRAADLVVVVPFVTVVLSAWLDAEPVSGGLALGGLLIVTGVYLGALRPAKSSPRVLESLMDNQLSTDATNAPRAMGPPGLDISLTIQELGAFAKRRDHL